MEETMSYRSRQDYLRTQRPRYQRAGRRGKGGILTEGCVLFGMHRKSLIRAFGRGGRASPRPHGPKRRYGQEVLGPLKLVGLINDLYRHEWRALQNFFFSSMRPISKSREGGRLRRHHDRARTPCERLLESPKVPEEGKAQLRRESASLDPFALRERCETKLRAIFRLARRSREGGVKARRAA